MFDTLLLRPSLHCNTPLHFTTLHPATLHYTSLHFTQLHFTTLLDTLLPLIYTSLSFHLALRIYISYRSISLHMCKNKFHTFNLCITCNSVFSFRLQSLKPRWNSSLSVFSSRFSELITDSKCYWVKYNYYNNRNVCKAYFYYLFFFLFW